MTELGESAVCGVVHGGQQLVTRVELRGRALLEPSLGHVSELSLVDLHPFGKNLVLADVEHVSRTMEAELSGEHPSLFRVAGQFWRRFPRSGQGVVLEQGSNGEDVSG